DEADEMLNMGFAEDLEAILAVTPKHRQTMLFSATMPPRIEEIAQKHLRKPVRIKVAREEPEQGEAAKVRQTAYLVNREHKAKALARVLEIERPTSAIVFCRTRSDADSLLEVLTNSGFKPLALHGGLTQHQRDQVMGRFRSGSSDLLVATDIAARGLDIAHLSHVINFDLPSDPDQYVHRIGRVGRAGVAITIATPREQFVLGQIERATRQKITIAPVPTAHDLQNSQLDRLRQRLRESLANTDDADGLKAIVDELASECSAVDVAVAALRLLHQPVQFDPGSDFATLQPSPREGRRDRGEGRADRGERRPERGDRPRLGPGRSAVEERSRAGRKPTGRGMAKLYFGIGRDAGVAPRDLVGAIANEAGVSGRDIGTIDMTDRFALVEVPVNLADFILEAMQGVRIRGRTVKVRADRPPL
ncbi:MAG: DEAD/DEAH box helicase, partial [Isosphaeraceae bacterium]